MKTEAYVDIDRPIKEVFEYTISNVAEWSSIVVEDKVVDGDGMGVGTKFETVTEDRGSRMVFNGEVIVHDPPYFHSIKMIGKQFSMDVDYAFEDLSSPTEPKTRVTQISDVTPKGAFKILFFVMGFFMKNKGCDEVNRELNNLKEALESKNSG